MSIYQMTEPLLDKDFHWLFDTVADAIDALVAPLGVGKISLPAIPRRTGKYIAPYAFAGRILLLFDYACGKQSLSKEYIVETEKELCNILTINVASFLEDEEEDDDVVDSDDSVHVYEASSLLKRFSSHPIVTVLLAAQGRLAINENRYLTETQFFALTGISRTRAERLGFKLKTLDNGDVLYDPNETYDVLKNVGA